MDNLEGTGPQLSETAFGEAVRREDLPPLENMALFPASGRISATR